MRLYRSLITGMLALLTSAALMAQSPHPATPAAPATAISLEEAARQLIDICTDHALGTTLIPHAQYRLQRMGFALSDSPGPARPDRSYTVDAPTTAGAMRILAELNGQCIIISGSVSRAAFDAVFSGAFDSSTSFARSPPAMWRWNNIIASVSELGGDSGMVRIRPFK